LTQCGSDPCFLLTMKIFSFKGKCVESSSFLGQGGFLFRFAFFPVSFIRYFFRRECSPLPFGGRRRGFSIQFRFPPLSGVVFTPFLEFSPESKSFIFDHGVKDFFFLWLLFKFFPPFLLVYSLVPFFFFFGLEGSGMDQVPTSSCISSPFWWMLVAFCPFLPGCSSSISLLLRVPRVTGLRFLTLCILFF